VRSHSCTADRTSSSSRLHNRDAVLELLSPFIHLCTTHTPVTVLKCRPTMNLYRFHAFAKQKSHNNSLLLLSALLQGHRHFVELFPRFLCVPQVCQRHLLVAQGHRLRNTYTQWYRSYTRFLIQLFRFFTERPLYVCMYACMYVCMYACMYVCIMSVLCVYVYVCMYVCMCVRMYVCISVRTYVCQEYVYVYVYISLICMYVRMLVRRICVGMYVSTMYVCMYVRKSVLSVSTIYLCMGVSSGYMWTYVCMNVRCMYISVYVSNIYE